MSKLGSWTAALALAGCAAAPGARVRVAFDRGGVTSVSARGFADPATHRRVTADDPVRVASVSKLVVALGVMRLVDTGTLDLDRDVSAYLGWPLRNPAYPDTPITLRLLLSHRSSLTDSVDYAIPLGQTLRATVADPKAWDAAHAPGGRFHYTNLNFPVVASVMEAAAGERFDRLMVRLVFVPLKLDACFNWTTCGDAKVARAVVLIDAKGAVLRDDLKGARPACPVLAPQGCDLSAYRPGDNGALFSPQGGLRISARDLSAIGRMLLNGGEGFLSPASLTTLTTPVWTYDGANGESERGFYCAYALAVQTLASRAPGCRDDPFGDARPRIGHAGEAYGVRSGLWINRAAKRGVAYFATAVPDSDPGKRSAFTLTEERLARGR
ncbi:MAG: beta-lactamase family protein [Sphingomonadaceae bacterium]|nr:beta-lactamase family protein [Sphingomonadaceae bacterium]